MAFTKRRGRGPDNPRPPSLLTPAAVSGIATGLFALSADQVTKVLVANWLAQPQFLLKLPSFVKLEIKLRPQVSFGLFGFLGESGHWLPTLFALLIVIALICWIAVTPNRWEGIGLGAIAGGIFGTVVDRLRLGAVPDLVDLSTGWWEGPAFNGADVAMAFGGTVLALRWLIGGDLSEISAPRRMPGSSQAPIGSVHQEVDERRPRDRDAFSDAASRKFDDGGPT